jgi:glyoxylase-like metal-dependent hydrolase (beta-lactamase superfamily II)
VRLEQLKDPHTVLPDEAVPDSGRTLKLGNTVLELKYMGLNHSDTNLVMLLPKEKLVFIVDTLPVGQVPGRGMIDFHPFETEQFIKEVIALDWTASSRVIRVRAIVSGPGRTRRTSSSSFSRRRRR